MSGLDPLTCRACLVTGVKLFNLHQIGLADLFGYLSKTAVAPSDGLPQYVCFYCRTQLKKFDDFQYKCQKSLIYFKENAQKDPSGFSIPLSKTRSLIVDCVPEDIIANDNLIYKIEEGSPNNNFNNSNKIIIVKNELDDLIDFNVDDDDRKTDETSLSCDEENNVTPEDNVKSEIVNETSILLTVLLEPLKEFKKLEFNDGDDGRKPIEKLLQNKFCDNFDEENNITLEHKEENGRSEIGDKIDIASESLKEFKKDENVFIDTNKVKDCLILKSRETKKKADTKNKQTAKKPKKKCNKYNEKFEEDFEEFSKIHNVKVVCLSKDEQIRRVQERKESNEYRDSRFSCDVCYKGFMSETAHKRHMKSHDPSSGAFVCEVCHMRYPTKRILLTHARQHKKIFVCALCDQVNVIAARAKLHSKWHKGVKFPCKTCHKEFKAHTTYLNHVREVHKSVSCAHCGQTLLGTNALQTHMRTHEQDVSVFTCELCGAKFSSDRNLYQHYIHSHEKRKENRAKPKFLCEKCAKSFLSPAHLKIHLRMHTGEKPYPCPTCPKSFRTKGGLKIHINVHTGDRPYKCRQCPETFQSAARRYKHNLLVHSGERRHKCSMCDKSYVVVCDLKDHIKYTHLNQPRPPRKRKRKQCGDKLAK